LALARCCGKDIPVTGAAWNVEAARDSTTDDGEQYEVDELAFLAILLSEL
jgi:hypothetical protein